MQVGRVRAEVAQGLWRNRTLTVTTTVAVAVATAMIGLALVIHAGLDAVRGQLTNRDDVSVYLLQSCDHRRQPGPCLTTTQQREVEQAVRAAPGVTSVVFVSSPDAYHRFSELLAGEPVVFGKPELADSLAVQVHSATDVDRVRASIDTVPGVTKVGGTDPALAAILTFFHQVLAATVVVVAVCLLLAIALTFNALMVVAHSRRHEIATMRLVGASESQIALPFVVQGAVVGVLGTTLALGLMTLGRSLLAGSFSDVTVLAPFDRWSTFGHALPVVVLIGVLLPAVVAYAALFRYLRSDGSQRG